MNHLHEEKQLEINGIGQQKVTLKDWKKQNKIYTHLSNFADDLEGQDLKWSCWNEIECPAEFGSKHSFDAMSLASTEKEAIIKHCARNEITPPFWW